MDSSFKRTSDPITGGLSAVIWTDLAQFVLMVGGAIGLSAVGKKHEFDVAPNNPRCKIMPCPFK